MVTLTQNQREMLAATVNTRRWPDNKPAPLSIRIDGGFHRREAVVISAEGTYASVRIPTARRARRRRAAPRTLLTDHERDMLKMVAGRDEPWTVSVDGEGDCRYVTVCAVGTRVSVGIAAPESPR